MYSVHDEKCFDLFIGLMEMRRMNMYLKRLESVGFKSFATRITIDFVPGVTAVVGPNGSGKSNITDAIRWVLGEQSARSLRGAKMEDIIFQGSDTRKPLNVAEVTLVLDNSDKFLPLDYEEVSVTRRVYRSGESEFYINKQSCRLKDIIDLFMDSGLGKESFSIISQGQVEEILSTKAEDRRVIFEEAAGVLKYKQRKEKAVFKLTETEDNLNRLNDIIYEIENQIEPLAHQSKIAKQYKEQAEQLKKLEISVLIAEIEKLHAEWEQLQVQIEEERLQEIEMSTAIQTREARLAEKRHAMQKIDEEIEVLQEKLLMTTQQLEQYEGKKQVWQERSRHVSENKEKLTAQKEHTLTLINELTKEMETENDTLSDLVKHQQATTNRIATLQRKLTTGYQDITETIEEQKAEYIELLNEQAAKRNEQQSIQQQLASISHKLHNQQEKYEALSQQYQAKESEKANIWQQYLQLETKLNKQKHKIDQLKIELRNKREEYDINQKKLYQGYEMITKLSSQKDMLEDLRDNYQGFYQGVKHILQARKNNELSDIHGAVIELIDVPHKFLLAIETVLGGQAQYIVVTDERAARAAIGWLKQTNRGRATFLPLASIQSRKLPTNILMDLKQHEGFIGMASDMVHTKDQYKIVVDHLIGNVVIAKTLKDANELSRMVNRRYRIVTLEGDVVNPGGSMSGGAIRRGKQSLFTRDRDLANITEKLTDYQQRTKAFEEKLDNDKEKMADLEKQIAKQELALHNQQEKLIEIQNNYQAVDKELISLQENITIYQQDASLFKEDQQDLQSRYQLLTEELNELKQALISTQDRIDQLTKEEKEFTNNREQMQEQLHQYEVSLAEQDERVKHQREKINLLNKQIQAHQDQYEQYVQELNEITQLSKSEESIESIEQVLVEKKSDQETYTQTIQQKRSERLQLSKLVEDEERELKEETKHHGTMLRSLQDKEVKLNRLDVELDNRLTTLQSEYTLTFEKARSSFKPAEEIAVTKQEIADLKKAIRQLGTVNLGAIDEYERLQERYQFLTKQRDDLLEAKETLYQVINEMDEVMKKRFSETFDQVQKEFRIVFKELFGGGRAQLTLTNPDDMLETGVEIIAQPPGKKLQHLGLLSGGEKALTAIALLFAMLRVRPVPFCVLDEVEAALDEVNVMRFAKYLKLHSDETQFIVITHRKGTMEEADVLYGVTMQESGVSRLVSVQLEDSLKLVSS
mgnify:FL=1